MISCLLKGDQLTHQVAGYFPRVLVHELRRGRAEGKTAREIRRCLKRYIARELYRQLTRSMNPPVSP
jgi:hypothetical protein